MIDYIFLIKLFDHFLNPNSAAPCLKLVPGNFFYKQNSTVSLY